MHKLRFTSFAVGFGVFIHLLVTVGGTDVPLEPYYIGFTWGVVLTGLMVFVVGPTIGDLLFREGNEAEPK